MNEPQYHFKVGFKCPRCSRYFKTEKERMRHLREHHHSQAESIGETTH